MNYKTKLKPGDTVYIIAGKDKGKTGEVEKIYADKQRILVKEINMAKKHVKPRGQQMGGIVSINRAISISNVMLVCPSCKKRTRVGLEIKGNMKQRICKKCGILVETKKVVSSK